jgi:hypothetical protein
VSTGSRINVHFCGFLERAMGIETNIIGQNKALLPAFCSIWSQIGVSTIQAKTGTKEGTTPTTLLATRQPLEGKEIPRVNVIKATICFRARP